MKIAIIVGSVRQNRQSGGVAGYLAEMLKSKYQVDFEYLDLLDYNFPVMEERLRMTPDPKPAWLEFSQKLKSSDGILIVSPEYNGSYPGALKNVLDYFKPEYTGKVFALATVSDGQWGGINAAHHLQSWVIHVKGILSPQKLHVPNVGKLFDSEGAPSREDFVRHADVFIKDLLWLSRAIAEFRQKSED